jgi:hypothetical protein
VVFNGLCGVGIKWGRHDPDPAIFVGSVGDLGKIGVHGEESPDLSEWAPDALLRDPWPGCERSGFSTDQCVGELCVVISKEDCDA